MRAHLAGHHAARLKRIDPFAPRPGHQHLADNLVKRFQIGGALGAGGKSGVRAQFRAPSNVTEGGPVGIPVEAHIDRAVRGGEYPRQGIAGRMRRLVEHIAGYAAFQDGRRLQIEADIEEIHLDMVDFSRALALEEACDHGPGEREPGSFVNKAEAAKKAALGEGQSRFHLDECVHAPAARRRPGLPEPGERDIDELRIYRGKVVPSQPHGLNDTRAE